MTSFVLGIKNFKYWVNRTCRLHWYCFIICIKSIVCSMDRARNHMNMLYAFSKSLNLLQLLQLPPYFPAFYFFHTFPFFIRIWCISLKRSLHFFFFIFFPFITFISSLDVNDGISPYAPIPHTKQLVCFLPVWANSVGTISSLIFLIIKFTPIITTTVNSAFVESIGVWRNSFD